MPVVEKTRSVRAAIDEVWAALTDAETIEGWMGAGEVKSVDLRVGGSYSIFGGSTTGSFTVIEAPRRLAYTWRQAEWPADWEDSLVEWDLSPTAEGTSVRLCHSRFPNEDERASHDGGWDDYFLDPLQDRLETSG